MNRESVAEQQVDVILAAYNAEATIARAAESVIDDPRLGRLVIVDDASSDKSRQVIQALAEKYDKILPVLLDQNVGPAQARNLGFEQSTAAWVAILDSDDWMDKNRLSTLVSQAISAQADIIADDVYMHQPDGSRASVWPTNEFTPFFINPAFFAQMNMESYAGTAREFGYIKPVFRAESLRRSGAPWRQDLRIMEDYDLYMRCLVAGDRFLFVPPAGYHYDRGTASRAFRPNDLGLVVQLDRAFAKQVSDRVDKVWIGRHADGLEALLIWVSIFGDRKLSALPKAVLRSILRPGIGRQLGLRLLMKLRGIAPNSSKVRDISEGSPADLVSKAR